MEQEGRKGRRETEYQGKEKSKKRLRTIRRKQNKLGSYFMLPS
jgi:hypothetical protein